MEARRGGIRRRSGVKGKGEEEEVVKRQPWNVSS
jgi:hypothetical protein